MANLCYESTQILNYGHDHGTLDDVRPDIPCCVYRPAFEGCRKYGTNMVPVRQKRHIEIGDILYSIHSQTHPFSVVVRGALNSYELILPSVAKGNGGHCVNLWEGWPTLMVFTTVFVVPQDEDVQLELQAEVEVIVPCEERASVVDQMLIEHNELWYLPILHEGEIHNLCSSHSPLILGQLE